MAQEVSLLRAFTPKLDGVRQRVDGLLMTADERATEVDVLQVVLFGLQIGDLADVVTVATSVSECSSRAELGAFGSAHLMAYSRLRETSSGLNILPSPIKPVPSPPPSVDKPLLTSRLPRPLPSSALRSASRLRFSTFPKLLAIVLSLSPIFSYPVPSP